MGGWLWAEMKENFILHILIIMWIFKWLCKLVKKWFEVLRRRNPVRRLENQFFGHTAHRSIPLLSDGVCVMRFESWVWVMDWCAQSCPISLETNSSWYHGAVGTNRLSRGFDRILLPYNFWYENYPNNAAVNIWGSEACLDSVKYKAQSLISNSFVK